MAGNNSIQFLRGNANTVANSTGNLIGGQPVYNEDKNYLTIGKSATSVNVHSTPIYVRSVVGYSGDTDENIGSLMTESYRIGGNETSSSDANLYINASRVVSNCAICTPSLQANSVGTNSITASSRLNINTSNPYGNISMYVQGASIELSPYNVNINASSGIFSNASTINMTYSGGTSGGTYYSSVNVHQSSSNVGICGYLNLPTSAACISFGIEANDSDAYIYSMRNSTRYTCVLPNSNGTIALISDDPVRSNVGNIGYFTAAANTTIANEVWAGTSSGSGTDIIGDVTVSGIYISYYYRGVDGSFRNGDYYGSTIYLQRNLSGTWQTVARKDAGESQVVNNQVDSVTQRFTNYQDGDRYQIVAYAKRPIPSSSITFNAICTYKEIGVDGDGNTLADIRISGVPTITTTPNPSNALINTAALANVIGVNGISFSQLNTRATVASLNSNVYTAYLYTANKCVGLRTMGTSRGVDSVTYSDSPVDITIYGAVIS